MLLEVHVPPESLLTMCAIKALHLFHQIDAHLLESHFQQLLAVSKDDTRQIPERKELTLRAIEVAGERFGQHLPEAEGSSQQYADSINEILSGSSGEALDEGSIRLVISQLRGGE